MTSNNEVPIDLTHCRVMVLANTLSQQSQERLTPGSIDDMLRVAGDLNTILRAAAGLKRR